MRAETSAGRTLPPWPILTILAASVLAVGPLLAVHFRQMWARPQYQYFPFVLACVAWLLWSRWSASRGSQPARTSTSYRAEIALGAVALLALVVAVFLYNPWLAAAAAVAGSGVGLLMACRIRPIDGAVGIWILLWLCLPLPFSLGANFTGWLQLLSSRASSQILDLLGVNHLMSGNVLQLPDREFFVDEACSGIISVMSVVACSAMFAIWLRRPLAHALMLIVTGVGWAVVMNIARISTIAIAASQFGLDLSVGAAHEVLGLIVFLLTFIAVVSTDRLLVFLLRADRSR